MSRISITHVTFIGPNVEPASVAFVDGVNLVRGPSDTGKSFIVDAIDFMMGARTLKEIPERVGYSTVLLGLRTGEGALTLSRSVEGGSYGLYRRDIRQGPLPAAEETLSPMHSADSTANISHLLLEAAGLRGRRIRKNARNETDSLSFRNIAHLCIVDETKMQSEVPPALTGSYVTKTKEVSVLKLLLQDEDDSDLIATTDDRTTRRVEQAKLEVVDGMLAGLRSQLAQHPGEDEVRAQLERVLQAISQSADSVENLAHRRDGLVELRAELIEERTRCLARVREMRSLVARFGLLQAQYDSDLDRLEMITEAGSLLGYFDQGTCVFCGAAVEHQHDQTVLADADASVFGASVAAEKEKTAALRADLLAALEDLDREQQQFDERLEELGRQIGEVDSDLGGVEADLQPASDGLGDLVRLRSSLESVTRDLDQVRQLEALRDGIISEAGAASAAAATAIDRSALREFSAEVGARLAAWGFPEAAQVEYDRTEQDLLAGDQLRSAHGKGVRAILHAAFTISLRNYCLDNGIGHPGFVVLDSPLVTYRAPDDGADRDGLLQPGPGFADAFYADLESRVDGQVIVMENTDPPSPLGAGSVDIAFTKSFRDGRYGYFPISE